MASESVPANEDIVLACAFIADEEKRRQILSLYAFLETLRDIPNRVSDPLMGEIRLRWWWEAIEEIDHGRPVRYHPLTDELKSLIVTHGLAPQAFYDLIEGQMPLLDKGELMIKAALGAVDRGEAIVARLAAALLDSSAEAAPLLATSRLYGLAGLKARRGLSDAGETERAHLHREAAEAMRNLPVTLMPLALPAALGAGIWRGRPAGPLAKRARLFWAFVSGRI
ncbi:squalene/phytoene synthase family protein [Asticcacaulis sp. EMRT-3]|uniref:squalene/phytoene synthase family protein n=1 Tax=Asticcacaulis sp. EMRT-3 TaxID=3040349 RepID=UPI0024AFAC78|nr:squalene/phytoene synthase family protein [Asticcacaulis sp. EMRT-3]MDI7774606.1 squalene/phytoene synthase family protein [Asticcacaulis sp. EMRT-3]